MGLTARSIGSLHTLKVKDTSPEGGCRAQIAFQLPGNTPLTYEHATTNVNCYGDSTGLLKLFNLKGTGGAVVEAFQTGTGALLGRDTLRVPYFNNDQFTLSGLPAGQYNFQLRQYGACTGASLFSGEITQNALIVLYSRNTYGSAPEFPEGELELDSARGGVGFLSYSFNGSSFEPFTDGIWKKDLPPGQYPVVLNDTLGCQVKYELIVYRDSVFAVPNVFTPDGDGHNDTWVIKNLPAGTSLTLTNRWGRKVYENGDYQNTLGAKDVEQGTYVYTLKMPDGSKRSGWLDVIK